MDKPKAKRPRVIRWVWELLIVIAAAAILAGFLAPGFLKYKTEAREAEVKVGLHVIQLALERYNVDSVGTYPEYLIGGEGSYTVLDERGRFAGIQECPDHSLLSDALLRGGYLEAYPKNPFARRAEVHAMQVKHDDPLRNGTEEAKRHGTRFGPYCTLMGNVLADFRYTEFTVFGDDGAQSVFPTYADVEYPCFDMWTSNHPTPFLPGEFFYKVAGVVVVAGPEEAERAKFEPVQASVTELYMLGGYGSIRTRGIDVLGPEIDIIFRFRQDGTYTPECAVPMWTRSSTTLKDSDDRFLGSPYGLSDSCCTSQFGYGSPNGIPDSIILVLVPYGEYRNRKDL